jgi:WD40 repeat protein
VRLANVLAPALVISVLTSATSAEPKVEEQIVAPADTKALYHLSPAGQHIATVTMQGSRSVVIHDGVAGPQFDEIHLAGTTGGFHLGTGSTGPRVLFSPDGARHAYAGRQGNQWVIMLDGKELCRIPAHEGASNLAAMQFSPDSKHLAFVSSSRPDGWDTRVFVDGVPGPSMSRPDVQLLFSPDGSRYAYMAAGEKDQNEHYLVVDGKRAGDRGTNPTFTASNKLLTISNKGDGTVTLLQDGKPLFSAAYIEPKFFVAPAGDLFAVPIKKSASAKTTLWIDGKEIDPGSNLSQVVFSPDGKRFAVICGNSTGSGQSQWAVFDDGKRTQEYVGLGNPRFTPDSKHFTFVGLAKGLPKYFVNIDESEFEGFDEVDSFTHDGTHFGFVGRNADQYVAIVDGQTTGDPRRMIRPRSLTFSPDGARHAYLANDIANPTPVVDGADLAGFQARDFAEIPRDPAGVMVPSAPFLFSPDGKHVLFSGASTTDGSRNQGLILDGQLLRTTAAPNWAAFTADGQHLLWTCPEPPQNGGLLKPRLYVDGVPSISYDRSSLDAMPAARSANPDGTVTFLAASGDSIKRFGVIPAADKTIASAIADQKQADVKSLADAQAAQEKSKADAAQAAVDAKVAQERAAADYAKARADAAAKRAEAAAAKTKARADALAKARADAEAKRAANGR